VETELIEPSVARAVGIIGKVDESSVGESCPVDLSLVPWLSASGLWRIMILRNKDAALSMVRRGSQSCR
jgi:hypothetical protein